MHCSRSQQQWSRSPQRGVDKFSQFGVLDGGALRCLNVTNTDYCFTATFCARGGVFGTRFIVCHILRCLHNQGLFYAHNARQSYGLRTSKNKANVNTTTEKLTRDVSARIQHVVAFEVHHKTTGTTGSMLCMDQKK